ncbi:NAD(P)H-dependent oxidoreductase [Flammeovirga kamogawensis]|uniref:NAD(P)H-dependent oxidoreductase n=1 Tax=Flammeovirga kamogawensis TaxID=373891 RepID=A0ABX8GZK0_9BACT|nr:NAD(P)H-dependent oxidoreductase [Flammeovirga kamogawensis]MBB6459037.1 putative NADPH-quinone reductase [Flammeovirga kamogawensis]QWG08607.1 NAD(P)H-dependent oxidoreductase [Flammeovirga kamogawensis]TRX66900.1 NAD(P)H-dependent oxidoreductase [Flammeovirga kamogawensis]
MKVVIVFNHPYEKSYCNAILEAVTEGLKEANHEVDLIHLDNDEFDPVMRAKDLKAFVTGSRNPEESYKLLDPQVKDYKNRLENAEHLIFIFPIWWELMPALTKGFIDKLIFPGIAYDFNPKGNRMMKKLNLSGVTMITTMNTPKLLYRILFGNAIKKAMLLGTFWKMGYKNRKWINLNMVKSASDEKRKTWLVDIKRKFAKKNL